MAERLAGLQSGGLRSTGKRWKLLHNAQGELDGRLGVLGTHLAFFVSRVVTGLAEVLELTLLGGGGGTGTVTGH